MIQILFIDLFYYAIEFSFQAFYFIGYFPILRVYYFFVFINALRAVLRHFIKVVIGYQVFEKIFLTPPAKHFRCFLGDGYISIGGDDSRLLATFIEASYFPEIIS